MTGDLAAAKRRLRRELIARRAQVDREQAERAGRAVARWLGGCARYASAGRVALYAALPDELPTRACFEALAGAGRVALFPRLAPRQGLRFHAVERWDELRPGSLGVLEPPATAPSLDPGAGDVVLVPGVAFDAAGHRLGRGGGHYDAAFPPGAAAAPLLVGVAYAFQVVPEVPHGSRDRSVDAIVTERGVLHAAGRSPR